MINKVFQDKRIWGQRMINQTTVALVGMQTVYLRFPKIELNQIQLPQTEFFQKLYSTQNSNLNLLCFSSRIQEDLRIPLSGYV